MRRYSMTKNSKEILEFIVKTADDRQAEDIVALDVQGISILADYFVIMNGNSSRQNRAIMNSLISDAAKNGIDVQKVEGRDSASWTLIDFNDVIVHIFSKEDREFYNLEKLWNDAELVNIDLMIEES